MLDRDLSYGQKNIIEAIAMPLETWANPHLTHPYLIHIEHPEFTSLCPRSGYPDFGTIVFDYYPDQLIAELKAIKLYINSFRNEHISHEAAVNQIADRFMEEVQPKRLRVIGDFMRRGNIKTVVTAQRGRIATELPFSEYQASKL